MTPGREVLLPGRLAWPLTSPGHGQAAGTKGTSTLVPPGAQRTSLLLASPCSFAWTSVSQFQTQCPQFP